jgi:hypothetical protein
VPVEDRGDVPVLIHRPGTRPGPAFRHTLPRAPVLEQRTQADDFRPEVNRIAVRYVVWGDRLCGADDDRSRPAREDQSWSRPSFVSAPWP